MSGELREERQMELKDIRTHEDLRAYLPEHIEVEPQDLNQVIDWYVAMTEATSMSDMFGRKDMANVMLEGLPPIKDNPQAVTDFLTTMFEDYDYCIKEPDTATPEEIEGYLEDAVEQLQDSLTNHFESMYTP